MKRLRKKVCAYLVIMTLIVTMLTPIANVSATTTDTMNVGSYVRFGSYYGNPILWRVINKDSNGTMLLTDRIITLKALDAYDGAEADASRRSYGNSNWEKSNLRVWLNSSAATVTYIDQKPDGSHVWGAYNPYDTEAGFLTNFSTDEQNAIVSVTHKEILCPTDSTEYEGGTASHIHDVTNPSTAVQNYNTAYYKNIIDKVFPLSVSELDSYVYSNAALGDGVTYYLAKPTTDAKNHSNYSVTTTDNWYYWLRDSYTGDSYETRAVYPTGIVERAHPRSGHYGCRVALYLRNGLPTSTGDGTSGNPYTLSYPLPLPSVDAGNIIDVCDNANNSNASDIRVVFKGASNESNIASYKIIVALASGTQPTDTVNSSLTTAATDTVTGNYMAEIKKGRSKIHLFTLPSKLQTYDGSTINGAAGTLKIYVLSVANAGSSDKLSAAKDLTSGITVNNSGHRVTAATPVVSDIANNENGTDLKVIFRKPKSEVNIASYRVIVSTTALTLAQAENVPTTGYKELTPINPNVSYTTVMGAAQKIQDGVTAIQNGTDYRLYILAIGKNGYANVLSSPSRVITLSQYVPGALTVKSLNALKTGTGHDSSNIKVTFYEPLSVSNVQEYRIFIAPAASTLSQTTAEGIADTSLYQVVSTTGKGAFHSVTLDAGKKDYNNGALAVGDYKVYVLTVGKTGYSNKLSVASGSATLN